MLYTAHSVALAGVLKWKTKESIYNPVKHLMNNIKGKMINTTNKQKLFPNSFPSTISTKFSKL